MMMMVFIFGRMIVRNFCGQEAPSRVAARSWSSGTPARPASRMRNISGVHCQMSEIITATSAQVGLDSQASEKVVPVKVEMMSLIGPPDWNSMKNM